MKASSRHFLKLLENASGAATWTIDLQSAKMTGSDTFRRMLDLSNESNLTIDTYASAVHADDRWVVYDLLQPSESMRSSREYRLAARGSALVWHRCHTDTIYNQSGLGLTQIGVVLDISESVERDQRLSRHHRVYETLLELSGGIAWRAGANGEAQRPESWMRFTAQTHEELVQGKWMDAIHPKDRPDTLESWNQALSRKAPFEARFRLRARDGAYQWINSRAAPVADAAGSIHEWLWFCSPEATAPTGGPASVSPSGAQIRAGRALVDWTVKTLSEASGISPATIARLEAGGQEIATRSETLQRLRRALETAGVIFTAAEGVALGQV